MAGVPFANAEEIETGIERMQESWIVSAHREPITCLCVHGLSLFSAGRDALLILYDLAPTHEREPPELLASITLPRVATSIAADRSRIYAATGAVVLRARKQLRPNVTSEHGRSTPRAHSRYCVPQAAATSTWSSGARTKG
jgi:hypothetical protein